MKQRFTDKQIIQMIKEQEAGEKTADVCRRCGISQGTFDKYKSTYGGMEPSDAKTLRALEFPFLLPHGGGIEGLVDEFGARAFGDADQFQPDGFGTSAAGFAQEVS